MADQSKRAAMRYAIKPVTDPARPIALSRRLPSRTLCDRPCRWPRGGTALPQLALEPRQPRAARPSRLSSDSTGTGGTLGRKRPWRSHPVTHTSPLEASECTQARKASTGGRFACRAG